jgi:hypothetical protein
MDLENYARVNKGQFLKCEIDENGKFIIKSMKDYRPLKKRFLMWLSKFKRIK